MGGVYGIGVAGHDRHVVTRPASQHWARTCLQLDRSFGARCVQPPLFLAPSAALAPAALMTARMAALMKARMTARMTGAYHACPVKL